MEANLAMLLAMLTLCSLSRCKVPIGRELSGFVAFGYTMEEDLALVDRLVVILICHGLNDKLTLNLEVDVVGSQGALGLLEDLSSCRDHVRSIRRMVKWRRQQRRGTSQMHSRGTEHGRLLRCYSCLSQSTIILV